MTPRPHSPGFAKWTLLLPAAASIFALACGCLVARDAVMSIFPDKSPDLGRYAFALTHLAVAAGLIMGGVVALDGLRRGSEGALLSGLLAGFASFAGMLVLQAWSLWTTGFLT